MWSDLPNPWQVCLEQAWEAYCNDCVPIGAAVTGPDGNVLSRGRNRIYENVKPAGDSNGAALEHAEVEALRALDLDAVNPHSCTLYTTTEPCPMCMGTFYMSGLRSLQYASRDPYAGSTNMLRTTWYLSAKQIKVSGPDPALEIVVVAMFVEWELGIHAGKLPGGLFWDMYGKTFAEGIDLGRQLFEQGELRKMRRKGMTAGDVHERISLLVK